MTGIAASATGSVSTVKPASNPNPVHWRRLSDVSSRSEQRNNTVSSNVKRQVDQSQSAEK